MLAGPNRTQHALPRLVSTKVSTNHIIVARLFCVRVDESNNTLRRMQAEAHIRPNTYLVRGFQAESRTCPNRILPLREIGSFPPADTIVRVEHQTKETRNVAFTTTSTTIMTHGPSRALSLGHNREPPSSTHQKSIQGYTREPLPPREHEHKKDTRSATKRRIAQHNAQHPAQESSYKKGALAQHRKRAVLLRLDQYKQPSYLTQVTHLG